MLGSIHLLVHQIFVAIFLNIFALQVFSTKKGIETHEPSPHTCISKHWFGIIPRQWIKATKFYQILYMAWHIFSRTIINLNGDRYVRILIKV
jgi:hypothetical protein